MSAPPEYNEAADHLMLYSASGVVFSSSNSDVYDGTAAPAAYDKPTSTLYATYLNRLNKVAFSRNGRFVGEGKGRSPNSPSDSSQIEGESPPYLSKVSQIVWP